MQIRQAHPIAEFAARLDADMAELQSMEFISKSEAELYRRRISISGSESSDVGSNSTPATPRVAHRPVAADAMASAILMSTATSGVGDENSTATLVTARTGSSQGFARSGTMVVSTYKRQSTSHAATFRALPQDTDATFANATSNRDAPSAPAPLLHRFTYGFMRDVIYHMMLFSQRQYIHQLVAEKLGLQIKVRGVI